MHGTGWKPDNLDLRTRRPFVSASKFGASPLPTMTNGLRPYADVRAQLRSQACTGFSFTSAAYIRLHAMGVQCPRLSASLTYRLGKMVGGERYPLPDDGAMPGFVAEGAMQYGMVPEAVAPFDPSSYQEDLVQEVDFRQAQLASIFRLTQIQRIAGPEDGAEDDDVIGVVMRTLYNLRPIPVGLNIGLAFERYRKGTGPIGIESDAPYRHMGVLLDYEDNGETFVGLTSWDKDYGDEGLFRITRDKLLRQASDRYDMNVIPVNR